jgi:endonuclease/exonuclease/phosphatase (EEP) superfamily protein YafD
VLSGPNVQASDYRGPVISLVSANLRTDNQDRAALMEELMGLDVDVILVQEYTPRWSGIFREEGLLDAYPYVVEAPRTNARGSAIFSRLPLKSAELWDMDGTSNTRAQLAGTGIWLYSVHPVPPRPHADIQWATLLEEVERADGPMIVAGDYNITQFNRWYERLEEAGMRSCHDETGQWENTTWPNGMYPVPPVRLDHVFVSEGLVCVSLREGKGAGSDHEPVIVEVGIAAPQADVR